MIQILFKILRFIFPNFFYFSKKSIVNKKNYILVDVIITLNELKFLELQKFAIFYFKGGSIEDGIWRNV